MANGPTLPQEYMNIDKTYVKYRTYDIYLYYYSNQIQGLIVTQYGLWLFWCVLTNRIRIELITQKWQVHASMNQ